ncbi:MAG TPA: MarR family transcriptional regulator [Polyangiaceae bacterium]|nr:MarR family transcriptional regulator [Polyangiaceae bacterium]
MVKFGKEALEATELLHELMLAQKHAFHAAAKECGLSPQQLATLWHLVPGEGMPMSAIAELLVCDASNVTGIVDKLEARGLAQRGQGEDRRVKVLTLTALGEELRTSMRERLLSPPHWLVQLTRDDQRALRDVLRRGLEVMRAGEKQP